MDKISRAGLEERLNVPGVEVDMWMDGKVMRSGLLGIREIVMIEILRGWDVVCNCMGMMWQLVLYWEE